ncbi:hypothetical protein [Nocardioides halotolerans]|uniref:hypothetical protein n=1 Tax=Nocardioides halotolerans TaxID=433660 RepID=UPI0012FC91EF|nr:hypothetical protein [Nocardioides halotolerans]
MNTNTIDMTANIPSSIGMPICGGHLSATSTEPIFGGLATTFVVRDRQAGAKGDMGLAAYVPGTTAWSPPTS